MSNGNRVSSYFLLKFCHLPIFFFLGPLQNQSIFLPYLFLFFSCCNKQKKVVNTHMASPISLGSYLVDQGTRREATSSFSSGTPTRRGNSSPLRDTDISSAQSSHISISSLSSGRLVRVTSKDLPYSLYNIPMYVPYPFFFRVFSIVSLRPGVSMTFDRKGCNSHRYFLQCISSMMIG